MISDYLPCSIEKFREHLYREHCREAGDAVLRSRAAAWAMADPEVDCVVEVQGSRLTLRHAQRAKAPIGGIRGQINDFTSDSRRRLLRLLMSLDEAIATETNPVIFMTLTIGRKLLTEGEAKKKLFALLKRLWRRSPNMSAIWKMEYQERGAVHFHLLCFKLNFLHGKELNQMWGEVINWDRSVEVADHPRCNLEAVKSWRGVMSYASKYLGKVVERVSLSTLHNSPHEDEEKNEKEKKINEKENSGRFWGVFRRNSLPLGVKYTMPARFADDGGAWFHALKRLARRIWEGVNRRYGYGFTIAVKNPQQWLNWAVYLSHGDVPPDVIIAVDG